MPIAEVLRECGKPLSIDTYKPEVVRATLGVGANLINDIWGFRRPGAIEAVIKGNAGLCVMHMQHDPETMQEVPDYADLMGETEAPLCTQTGTPMAAGVMAERISLGPGLGFGRTPDHNPTMPNRLVEFQRIGLPLFAGLSRKSTPDTVLDGKPPAKRMTVNVAAVLLAAERGTFIVCVHDVWPTLETIQLWRAICYERVNPLAV